MNRIFLESKKQSQIISVELASGKVFDVAICFSNETAGGKLYLVDENGKIPQTITLPFSGGATKWKTVALKQGINKIKVRFEKGNFNLNFLEFKNPRN